MGKNNARPSAVGSTRQRAGFSLVEVAILAVLLVVAVGGLAGAVLSSLRLANSSEESAQADEATRALAARIQTLQFDQLFKLYNGYPKDDPNGEGTGPGAAFDVLGLEPQADDPDGRVGRIVFPAVDVGGGVQALREDVEEPRLGMVPGRDLNGDGDALDDVTNGYVILPARLIVEWTGAGGDRSYELDLLLVP